MLSSFSLGYLLVILNLLSENSSTCVITVGLWCLLCLFRLCFSLPYGMPGNFLLKGRHNYQIIRTEVNRSLVWGCELIWWGIDLCLMFAVAIGIRGFKLLQCLCFCLSPDFRFPEVLLLRASLYHAAISARMQYWDSAVPMVW